MENDPLASLVDGSYLLPSERLIPENIARMKAFSPLLADIQSFMEDVNTAIYNYQAAFATKIIVNPADIRTYIDKIRSYLVNMSGGYDTDGVTLLPAQATTILPDILMNLRDNQLVLCQLYAMYEDSQGSVVGPLADVAIEDTADEGDRS